jgi:hypothetical protein
MKHLSLVATAAFMVTGVTPAFAPLKDALAPVDSAIRSPAPTTSEPDHPRCTPRAGTTADSTWRLARGNGFTFCVPEKWSPRGRAQGKDIDPPEWRGPGGTKLLWTTGEAPVLQTRVPFTTTTIGGGIAPARNQPIPQLPQVITTIEVVGGSTARFVQAEGQGGMYLANAAWQSPIPLRLRGETRDRKARDLLLEIFRTVRFDDP